jgi:hypothetical protein
MRAIFAVNVAAGITLLFAVLSMIAASGNAYMTHRAITMLNPTGDDLDKMKSFQNEHLDTAAESFAVTLLQGTIIIYARKLNKQSKTI